MWQALFANLAVTAIMLTAWNSVGDRVSRLSPIMQRVLLGVAMAAGAVGSMMMAYQVSPGVIYDFRGPIIAVSALFGGLPAALITGAAALAYRIYLGGAIGPGAVTIVLCAGIGLAGYALRRKKGIEYADIFALAAAVALTTVIVAFALPANVRSAVFPVLSAPIFLSFVSTVLLSTVLLHESRRRALFVSNRLYRSMVDALPDCLNIKDMDGRFLAANPATAKLMRAASAEELIGKTDFDFYPAELAKSFRKDELAIFSAARHATIEQSGRLPDGSAGWLSTLKAPVVDDDGATVAMVTHNRDITAQKLLQTKLSETQAYLDQALDHMNDGLAMYDRDGLVLFCNDRYRELFPLTAHLRVPGSAFVDIIRASAEAGEEPVPQGKTIDAHIAQKLAALRSDGEEAIELGGGQTFLSRTKVLPNGCTLRMMSDVTERKNFEKNLQHQALHDPLTGLPNRAYFNRELDRLLEKARAEGSELVVMLLDLDRFKQVNDSFGHGVGDKLLVEVAKRLEESIRRGDLAARLGGDEFAILMAGPTNGTGDISLATRIMKNLTRPLKLDGVALLPGGTIGYTVYPRDDSDPEGLLKNADKALYQAKAKGRGSWKAFDPQRSTAATAATAARA